jgi:ectoine hydroxylase-related dioxygenase (phytanoyl-CoA dioxygenase family)
MLSKPPGRANETPWHQDEAYWEPDRSYQAVGAWMPLDDADIDNGCLWFLPGSHLGDVRRHRHVGNHPDINLLELAEHEVLDVSTAVPVPLRAGGASFHHPRMFHYARPNTTGRLRRAFANEFQTVPQRLDPPADRPWVLESRQAFERRIVARMNG